MGEPEYEGSSKEAMCMYSMLTVELPKSLSKDIRVFIIRIHLLCEFLWMKIAKLEHWALALKYVVRSSHYFVHPLDKNFLSYDSLLYMNLNGAYLKAECMQICIYVKPGGCLEYVQSGICLNW